MRIHRRRRPRRTRRRRWIHSHPPAEVTPGAPAAEVTLFTPTGGGDAMRTRRRTSHITVKDFAKFLGLSILKPFANAT